jgi:chromate transporter
MSESNSKAPTASPPQDNNANVAPAATLTSLFWLFLQIGAMSFGGGLMAWVYREVVDRRRWMSSADLMSGIALAQVLPGVNITNLSIYVGHHIRGALGSAVCLIALLTAPFFLIIGLAAVYAQIDSISWAHNFMAGVATAAVGLVLSVTLRSVRNDVRGIGPIAVLLAVFITIGVLRWPLVPVIAALAPISVALAWYASKAKADA